MLSFRKMALVAYMAAVALISSAQVTVNIDTSKRGPEISKLHYGIFYEEINHAGDGGIYGELIRNRSFEDELDGNYLLYWSAAGGATLEGYSDNDLMNDAQNGALRLTMTAANQGAINEGYWGIKSKAGDTYKFCFWVKADTPWSGVATVALKDDSGNVGAQTAVNVNATAQWQRVSGEFTATENIDDCKFYLTFDKAGVLELDFVSLFPPTFKSRDNGCRVDLAELLQGLNPSFVRFPGGCYVEGDGSVESNRRFEWKKTIGPVEQRAGHYNQNWGYPCTDGMGFHEFLQLTEDLGAEPLFVVNVGLGHGWAKPYDDIDEYIQEALDAIEYCNGDETTTWGAQRAANGHPAPFNLRLLEIGNENYNYTTDVNDKRFDHYAERYKAFYDAIKAKYPDMILIGNVEAWGLDNPTWRNPHPVELVDEHYYRTPVWFEQNYGKYDSYDRTGPKVYVGEYAVTDPKPEVSDGIMKSALGEAVYMLGMERNSDMVVMNSYAPIFYNEDAGGGWLPDMIRFSHSTSYGTPSYHVQAMMANTVGAQNLAFTEEGNFDGMGTKVGFSSWSTRCKYDNIKISTPEGDVIYSQDFSTDAHEWVMPTSNWKITNGVLSQTNSGEQGRMVMLDVNLPSAYVFECDAMKESGAEGFLVAFNVADEQNCCWWNIGGWNNGQHGLQLCKDGTKTENDLKPGNIEANRTYRVRVEVDGQKVKCYLDDQLIHDFEFSPFRKLYMAVSTDKDDSKIILKVVNTSADTRTLSINNVGGSITDVPEIKVLSAASDQDKNTAQNPDNIVPKDGAISSYMDGRLEYDAPPFSLSILTLTGDIASIDEKVSTWTDDQQENARKLLAHVAGRLNNLHENMQLPTTLAGGIKAEWYIDGASAEIAVGGNQFVSILNILKPNNSNEYKVQTPISVDITYPDGAKGTLQFPTRLAPKDELRNFLLVAPAKTTGLMLAAGNPETHGHSFGIIQEAVGIESAEKYASTSLARQGDAFVLAAETADGLNTDLYTSADLVHWEKRCALSGLHNLMLVPQADGAYVAYFNVDGKEGIYSVKISSKFEADQTHQCVISGTDEHPFAIASEYDGTSSLFTVGTSAGIINQFVKPEISDASWNQNAVWKTNAGKPAHPFTLRRPTTDIYAFYYYDNSKLMATDIDSELNPFAETFEATGVSGYRPGAVVLISDAEMEMLQLWRSVSEEIAKAKAHNVEEYAELITEAEQRIATTTRVESLTELFREILKSFNESKDVVLRKTAPEAFNDITSLLENPNFSITGGWLGTAFTAVSAGVAEHYDKSFDTYQILENMPTGTYRLECSGFYRYGNRNFSYLVHNSGHERLMAHLYINNSQTPFLSLHHEGRALDSTIPDNVWSANSAFNSENRYGGNTVEYTLEQPGDICLGVRKKGLIWSDWNCFDNFKLYYKSAKAGVDNVAVDIDDTSAPVEYYNLQGIRVLNPAPGIYVVRRGTKVSKEILR